MRERDPLICKKIGTDLKDREFKMKDWEEERSKNRERDQKEERSEKKRERQIGKKKREKTSPKHYYTCLPPSPTDINLPRHKGKDKSIDA